MNTFDFSAMGQQSGERLERSDQQKNILLIYIGITLGLSVLVTLISALLSSRISQSGGLGNMGTKTTLSTIQSMLPIVQMLIMMCLEVGFLNAMLRIARGQYASPNSLRLGFDRLWVLLRMNLIRLLIFSGLGFGCVYASAALFLLTPFSQGLKELLLPLLTESSILSQTPVMDAELYAQVLQAMIPTFILWGILYFALAIPLLYRYRMANYVIIDKPGLGAIAALRESRMMMRGHRLELFKLDLRLWPYYLGLVLTIVIGYGDVLLELLGVPLPISADVAYYLFYGLSIAAMFGVYYFMRSRVEVIYAMAYDAVKPQPPQQQGVVLGNIFQM